MVMMESVCVVRWSKIIKGGLGLLSVELKNKNKKSHYVNDFTFEYFYLKSVDLVYCCG